MDSMRRNSPTRSHVTYCAHGVVTGVSRRFWTVPAAPTERMSSCDIPKQKRHPPPPKNQAHAQPNVRSIIRQKVLSRGMHGRPMWEPYTMAGGAPVALSDQISLCRHQGHEELTKFGRLGEHGAVWCAASAATSRNRQKNTVF